MKRAKREASKKGEIYVNPQVLVPKASPRSSLMAKRLDEKKKERERERERERESEREREKSCY